MAFDSIHNYYERLVIEHILELSTGELAAEDEDFLSDVACVALNQLPSRYVRHNVDMVFYMTPQERAQMEQEVINAIKMGIEYVNKHRGDERPETISG